MIEQLLQNISIFQCPACKGDLRTNKISSIQCMNCRQKYGVADGIPKLLFLDDDGEDITLKIRNFYEQSPFPNYEEFENLADLADSANRSVFGKLLNEQLPYNTRILEVGCGTGQLTNFLGSAQRDMFGVDMSLNSLKLGQKFKNDNHLDNVGFYQMNIFKPIFRDQTFDYVICNGVLHHTKDPYLGFRSISRLVKKGGYILIGLYNLYARLMTDIRRMLIQTLGNRFKMLDPRLRDVSVGELRKHTWFLDQYQNPHESKHTVSEVINWFNQNGFKFVNNLPSVKLGHSFSEKEILFQQLEAVNNWEIWLSQLLQIPKGSHEGGLFITIGKRI